MLAFEGHTPPARILAWLGQRSLGGFTLFGYAQGRELAAMNVNYALAAAWWGEVPFQGKLPVQIPDLYPAGRGLSG